MKEQEHFLSRRILYVMNLRIVRGEANLMITFAFYHNYYFAMHYF